MDELLWLRVSATFLADLCLAVLCGLLLSSLWLRDSTTTPRATVGRHGDRGPGPAGLGLFAVLLLLAVCVQLLLLAMSFCGQTSLEAVMGSMPDVCSTHAGGVSLALCGAAAALCAATLIPSRRLQLPLSGLFLFGCLGLHALTGHAAMDGVLSMTGLLQLIHLLGMAFWSGGVIVSGLFLVPRLSIDRGDGMVSRKQSHEMTQAVSSILRRYLGRLSLVSTWALVAVVLSGILKGYRATEGSLEALRSSHWGHILIAKAAVVTLTVLLGGRNRWLLASSGRWNRAALRSAIGTLRGESICMLAVLFLSAWLANSATPMD